MLGLKTIVMKPFEKKMMLKLKTVILLWQPFCFSYDVQNQLDVNQISGFQATAFTSNILHRVQCYYLNCCGGHLGFLRMPQINTVRGITGIKTISKCEVNPTCGFQATAFTSKSLHRIQC